MFSNSVVHEKKKKKKRDGKKTKEEEGGGEKEGGKGEGRREKRRRWRHTPTPWWTNGGGRGRLNAFSWCHWLLLWQPGWGHTKRGTIGRRGGWAFQEQGKGWNTSTAILSRFKQHAHDPHGCVTTRGEHSWLEVFAKWPRLLTGADQQRRYRYSSPRRRETTG